MKNMKFWKGAKAGDDANAAKGDSGAATADKDLQKLRRVDLLELLVDQTRENEAQAAELAELSTLTERLKAKLDDKDAQIERLKAKLDDKDAQIAYLQERNRLLAHSQGLLDMSDYAAIEENVMESYLGKYAVPGSASAGYEGHGATGPRGVVD